GTGVPVPNPSAVGGLLELLPRRERVAACRPGDGLGAFLRGLSPGVEQPPQNWLPIRHFVFLRACLAMRWACLALRWLWLALALACLALALPWLCLALPCRAFALACLALALPCFALRWHVVPWHALALAMALPQSSYFEKVRLLEAWHGMALAWPWHAHFEKVRLLEAWHGVA
ncbi:unnamed protein product, partial [Prunus brigantina]